MMRELQRTEEGGGGLDGAAGAGAEPPDEAALMAQGLQLTTMAGLHPPTGAPGRAPDPTLTRLEGPAVAEATPVGENGTARLAISIACYVFVLDGGGR